MSPEGWQPMRVSQPMSSKPRISNRSTTIRRTPALRRASRPAKRSRSFSARAGVPAMQSSQARAVTLDDAVARDDDVEAIVHLAFLDDLLSRRVVLPAAGAQHFPDLRVRELVEKLQAPQNAELLLPIDARVVLAQLLMHARELGGKIKAALAAFGR